MPEPLCLVDGIVKVSPGTTLRYSHKQGAKHNCYYTIGEHKKQKELSFDEAARQCKTKIEEAVGLRMVADVPVGCFLSGGVDSSIITSIAQKLHGGVQTYSIGFEGRNFLDETSAARQTAHFLGTKHNNIILSDKIIFDHLDLFFDAMDEPFADSSAINVFHLCRSVKNHITVALGGDGADEVFGGYNKHRALQMSLNPLYRFILSTTSPFWLLASSSRGSAFRNKTRQLKRLSAGMSKRPKGRYAHWAAFSNPKDVSRCLTKPHFGEPSFMDLMPDRIDSLNHFLYADQKIVLPSDMLTKVDKMSMASSLEVRVPFLDHHVVDFANSLPSATRLRARPLSAFYAKVLKMIYPMRCFTGPNKDLKFRWKTGLEMSLVGELNNLFNKIFSTHKGYFYTNPYVGYLNPIKKAATLNKVRFYTPLWFFKNGGNV